MENGKDLISMYAHQVTFLALAPAASTTQIITIESDSDFFWYKATYQADIAAAAQTDSTRVVPLCTVLITDNGSDRQLMRAAVPVPSIFGTGETPFILPAPHKFLASASVTVQVTNFDAAATYNLRLQFVGYKKFIR